MSLPSPAPFLTQFLQTIKDGSGGDEYIHNALQGLLQCNVEALSESTARKLNMAIRKAGATISTPGKRNPVQHILNWIAEPLAPGDPNGGSGVPNRSTQEPGRQTRKRKTNAANQTSHANPNEPVPTAAQAGGEASGGAANSSESVPSAETAGGDNSNESEQETQNHFLNSDHGNNNNPLNNNPDDTSNPLSSPLVFQGGNNNNAQGDTNQETSNIHPDPESNNSNLALDNSMLDQGHTGDGIGGDEQSNSALPDASVPPRVNFNDAINISSHDFAEFRSYFGEMKAYVDKIRASEAAAATRAATPTFPAAQSRTPQPSNNPPPRAQVVPPPAASPRPSAIRQPQAPVPKPPAQTLSHLPSPSTTQQQRNNAKPPTITRTIPAGEPQQSPRSLPQVALNRRSDPAPGIANGYQNLTITASNTRNPLLASSVFDGPDEEETALGGILRDLECFSEGTCGDSGNGTDDDDQDFLVWEEPNPRPKRQRTAERPSPSAPVTNSDDGHLNCVGLRQSGLRTRRLAHQNGLPAIMQWLQAGGHTLQKFVAGQTHLSAWEKQEVDYHLHVLLLIADQFQPEHLSRIDATDALIRRIMAICLQTKLDSDFLEVFSNPSGSHLAPLGLLTEANKVFQVIKKARGLDSKCLSQASVPTLPLSNRVAQPPQYQQPAMMPQMFPQMMPPHMVPPHMIPPHMAQYPQFAPMMQLPPPPQPIPTEPKTPQKPAKGNRGQGTKQGKQGAMSAGRSSDKN